MKKHFVITIGREFGSGGRQIGMALAEKLGVKISYIPSEGCPDFMISFSI